MSVAALAWAYPVTESRGDEARKLKAAAQAAADILKDRNRLDGQAVKTIDGYLRQLQKALRELLLVNDDALTDFARRNLSTLLHDVDRLVGQTTRQLQHASTGLLDKAAALGDTHAADPLIAAGIQITKGLPGLDQTLVTATYNNVARLLTTPMQQFATAVQGGIRRVANGGANTFEEIARLRNLIERQGFDNAQYKAERIIRTEVGRIFNESNFTRLEQLAQQFPFIRKCWKDSHDNRVRLGHVQAGDTYARGSGIPIAELFKVNVYREIGRNKGQLLGVAFLRFPVDPETTPAGRIAAGATIMCRCNAFVDFEQTDFRSYSRSRISTILSGARPAPGAPLPYTATHATVPDSAHPNLSRVLPGKGGTVPLP